MIQFLDCNKNNVEFTFSQNHFLEEANHVLVICQYGEDWVLTKHKKRGLEFPGGKRELGESLEEAARREAYEETGAILDSLKYIAEYRVSDEQGSFVKAVFWGMVNRLEKTSTYHETNGPVMVNGNLLELRFGPDYSFIMQDKVVEECLKHIEELDSGKE